MALQIAPDTNIESLVESFPIARDVLAAFGLGCSSCSVKNAETIEAGAKAHGLRVEPILAALSQARLSGRAPTIINEDKKPHVGAPGAFAKRGSIKAVVPIMSGKGGVGKSLTTALLAVAPVVAVGDVRPAHICSGRWSAWIRSEKRVTEASKCNGTVPVGP